MSQVVIEKIFTGTDKALELGYPNFEAFLRGLAARKNFKCSGRINKSVVYARVDFGRWLADCECGGAGYVDPDKPIFFCATCGNQAHGTDFRTVEFPPNRSKIEAVLLERPVILRAGLKPVDQAMNAILPLPGLARQWVPGETVETLKRQHRDCKKAFEAAIKPKRSMKRREK